MSYFTKSFDERIVKLLKSGSVGFMPSDTVYSLSAVALNEDSARRIYKVKGRDRNKPFIVLLAGVSQAKILGLNLDDFKYVRQLWPAQLTFICAAGNSTPLFLHKGRGTLAIRVPDSSRLRQLIAKTGPLLSTSANLQGEPVVNTVSEAKKKFGHKLDFFVDSGKLSGKTSTIVQMQNNRLKVIRQGAYKINAPEVGKTLAKTL